MIGLYLSFLILPAVIWADSPVTCSSNNTACNVHGNTLIDYFTGIEGILDCRKLCYGVDECEFITYYGPNGFPLLNICELYRSCNETFGCDDCVTETEDCYKLCSSNTIGPISENLLGFIPDTESEPECKALCRQTTGLGLDE